METSHSADPTMDVTLHLTYEENGERLSSSYDFTLLEPEIDAEEALRAAMTDFLRHDEAGQAWWVEQGGCLSLGNVVENLPRSYLNKHGLDERAAPPVIDLFLEYDELIDLDDDADGSDESGEEA